MIAAATIEAHLDRLKRRRPRLTRREALKLLARAQHRLDVRDDAYRRLVAHNARLEADRRFAETVATAITAAGDLTGYDHDKRDELLAVILGRYDELVLDQQLAEPHVDTTSERLHIAGYTGE